MTYEEILKDILSRVPNDVDKRQGSIIYDTLAPTAIKDVQIHQDFSIAFDNLFPDTTKDEATLIRFGAERDKPYENQHHKLLLRAYFAHQS